ncbi:MAG: nucleotidyltransferase domain-containing protein [Euryarchaeota archaeon]|nr:nucleotidyltransferase domain-containing protein [Euryarchaeota archaeon]
MGNSSSIQSEYRDYITLIVKSIKGYFKENLISLVLYGSVAREEAGEGSDLDFLVVSKSFASSFGSRFEVFNEIEKKLRQTEAYQKLKELKFGTLISPVPLTPDEIIKNPPILLDIITDGIILYDKNDFIKNHLKELEKKLEKIGAKKIFLKPGKWYWDLKPDYKLGEVVEI